MAGRKKRSERLLQEGTGLAVTTRPSEVSHVPGGSRKGKSTVSAFCPVCGRAVHENRTTKRASIGALESKPYFESIDWQPDQPFGRRQAATGKWSFRNWSYINPEDAPELFAAMKARFLTAAKEWLAKDWITEGEVLAVLGEIHGPGKPSPNGRHNGSSPQRNGHDRGER
jgi:hypothetical protein